MQSFADVVGLRDPEANSLAKANEMCRFEGKYGSIATTVGGGAEAV